MLFFTGQRNSGVFLVSQVMFWNQVLYKEQDIIATISYLVTYTAFFHQDQGIKYLLYQLQSIIFQSNITSENTSYALNVELKAYLLPWNVFYESYEIVR